MLVAATQSTMLAKPHLPALPPFQQPTTPHMRAPTAPHLQDFLEWLLLYAVRQPLLKDRQDQLAACAEGGWRELTGR